MLGRAADSPLLERLVANYKHRAGAPRCAQRSWRQHLRWTRLAVIERHPLERHGSLGHGLTSAGMC